MSVSAWVGFIVAYVALSFLLGVAVGRYLKHRSF